MNEWITPVAIIFFLWQALQGLLVWFLNQATKAATEALDRNASTLQNIHLELNRLNQNFAALEAWRLEHMKHDDSRIEEHRRRLDRLENRRGREET